MTIDEFLIEHLEPTLFEEPYFYFWVKTVLEAMELLGPETDDDLNRLRHLLLEYYTTDNIPAERIDDIPHEIVRLRGVSYWNDTSPLGLKYRCLNAVGSSIEANRADLDNWQYGIVTAFQLINLDQNKDRILIERIREGVSKYIPPSPRT